MEIDIANLVVELNTVFYVEVPRGVLTYSEARHLEDLVTRLVKRYCDKKRKEKKDGKKENEG